MNNNDKQVQAGNAVLVLVAMVLGVLIGVMFASHGNRQTDALQNKMSEVMGLVQDEYVDAVDTDSLSERLIAAMLSELDPHSTYLSLSETERADEMMRGSFEGVGLVLRREGDTTFVGQVLADGPSAKSDIHPGDRIVSVDGREVLGLPSDTVVSMLRGPKGSTVEVKVESGSEGRTIKLRRGVVPHHTVLCATMIDDTTGYISLSTFAGTSHDEFREALAKLKRQGMQHLIFDLRGNGGGSLTSAVGIAAELLPRGSLIVYTQGAHSRRRDVKAPGGGLFPTGRITVLVDESSASASEVVSGALQDNDRATIMGRRTFGKGLVQTEFALNDGSAVLLTTARYYTPSGRCIQRDYTGGTDQYYRQYLDQLIDESYADSMTTAVFDSTPYRTVGGRTVYGGGGITPDVLLPYHKDSTLVYFNRLQSKGVVNRTAFHYVRRHGAELQERYADAKAFRKWRVPEELVQAVVANGEAEGIERNSNSLKAQRHLIEAIVKADIGMALYGNEAYYDAYLPTDDDVRRAREMKGYGL